MTQATHTCSFFLTKNLNSRSHPKYHQLQDTTLFLSFLFFLNPWGTAMTVDRAVFTCAGVGIQPKGAHQPCDTHYLKLSTRESVFCNMHMSSRADCYGTSANSGGTRDRPYLIVSCDFDIFKNLIYFYLDFYTLHQLSLPAGGMSHQGSSPQTFTALIRRGDRTGGTRRGDRKRSLWKHNPTAESRCCLRLKYKSRMRKLGLTESYQKWRDDHHAKRSPRMRQKLAVYNICATSLGKKYSLLQ